MAEPMLTPPTRAAWAPWGTGDASWLQHREQLACAWLERAAQAEGSAVVVVAASDARSYRDNQGALGRLARSGRVSTYRSSAGPGPAYVNHPDIRLLATGMRTGRGHSLVATEVPTMPLRGWAMAVGAVDLSSGEKTPDTRTSAQIDMVASFVRQLYNGWSHKEVGRRACRHYLPKLADSGMSYAEFVGSVLAAASQHLDSTSEIEAMKKSLPAVWEEQRVALSRHWT